MPLNVLIQGYFNVSNNAYRSGTIAGVNAGFPTNGAVANQYSTCMYPSWASFNINATAQYHSGNDSSGADVSSFFFQKQPVSNSVLDRKLYINTESTPILYQIFVENATSLAIVPSLVKEGLYDIGTGTSVQITEIMASGGLTGYTYLDLNQTYTFDAYTSNGH